MRAEDDLLKAVVVTVVNDRSEVSAKEIAPRLEVQEGSLVLQQASAPSFLLVLPNTDQVARLTSRWPMIKVASFSISCRRWSRLIGASSGVLLHLIDVELSGIPFHAWETLIVDHFLNPYAWIQKVHPETIALVDLSVFKFSTWCLDPTSIPAVRDLWIVEPPGANEEGDSGKRKLVYPINVGFTMVLQPTCSCPSHPPPPDGSDKDGSPTKQRRRFRSRSPPAGSRGQGHGGRSTAGSDKQRRKSVHARLGPCWHQNLTGPIDQRQEIEIGRSQ
ncbi:hypothetical protein PR202_gb16077 [Eleusine coracana subsp. coracana]|uniref:DUF4283 domain-containing protein n=1 Tax=Eleusine coracana subsp. coracana TaxID=191504 RepID=A0AAV5F0P5_ELECO|nr:hypothetical protein PR202_gb16077 [Eleusine coracana subsp. coracana]